MFERPSGRSKNKAGRIKAVLVSFDFGERDAAEHLEEFKLLASSAGVEYGAVVRGRRDRPDPKHFAGSGKVEEIRAAVSENAAGLVIFNHELSPAQQRNLETTLGCRILDRVSLILEIFGQRARSHEGKLQVELAQLEYLATRLVRGWTHLERQRGGRGTLGGMGEKQIEVDRRLIGRRVKSLKDQLVRLKRQRLVQRRARVRGQVLSVSLVGYTNAGKSTLFNALAHAGAYAADQLFATLDTTTRRVYVPGAGRLVVSDTVGFSATCRIHWWRHSARRWRKPSTPICCCMWWTHPARAGTPRSTRSTRCWARSAPPIFPRSSSGTRSI